MSTPSLPLPKWDVKAPILKRLATLLHGELLPALLPGLLSVALRHADVGRVAKLCLDQAATRQLGAERLLEVVAASTPPASLQSAPPPEAWWDSPEARAWVAPIAERLAAELASQKYVGDADLAAELADEGTRQEMAQEICDHFRVEWMEAPSDTGSRYEKRRPKLSKLDLLLSKLPGFQRFGAPSDSPHHTKVVEHLEATVFELGKLKKIAARYLAPQNQSADGDADLGGERDAEMVGGGNGGMAQAREEAQYTTFETYLKITLNRRALTAIHEAIKASPRTVGDGQTIVALAANRLREEEEAGGSEVPQSGMADGVVAPAPAASEKEFKGLLAAAKLQLAKRGKIAEEQTELLAVAELWQIPLTHPDDFLPGTRDLLRSGLRGAAPWESLLGRLVAEWEKSREGLAIMAERAERRGAQLAAAHAELEDQRHTSAQVSADEWEPSLLVGEGRGHIDRGGLLQELNDLVKKASNPLEKAKAKLVAAAARRQKALRGYEIAKVLCFRAPAVVGNITDPGTGEVRQVRYAVRRTQAELALLLGLSQPTVSRRLSEIEELLKMLARNI